MKYMTLTLFGEKDGGQRQDDTPRVETEPSSERRHHISVEIFRVGGHWYFSGKTLKGWSTIYRRCVSPVTHLHLSTNMFFFLHISIHFNKSKATFFVHACAASTGLLTRVTFTKRDVNTKSRREVLGHQIISHRSR